MAANIPVSDLVVASLNRVFKNLPQVFRVGLLPMIVILMLPFSRVFVSAGLFPFKS